MPAGENINVMEVIWQSVEKGKDGAAHYPLIFIDYLWNNGFIDTQKFPRAAWHAAVESFKQADGHYRFNHDEFASLEKYRYQGEIKIPFDPLKINEGKYTDEGFGQLVNDSIAPSCALETKELNKFVEDLKKEFRQPDDLILIKMSAKIKVKKMIDENPSPLHRVEILFDEMLRKKGIEKEIEADLQRVTTTASPDQVALLQRSTFSLGPANLAEAQAARLKHVTQSKAPPLEIPPEEGSPLKNIKRSKKGIRG